MIGKKVPLAVVIVVVLGSLGLFVGMLFRGPEPGSVPFHNWYGNWRGVLLATGLFTLFLLGFARPRRRLEWRNAGLYTAFLVSLFTEMFGLPLTIFLIAPALGLSPSAFGASESHLWAYLLDRLGLVSLPIGVYLVMVASIGLIGVGASLVAIGWYQVYQGKGELVTGGIYGVLRHPQYLGLILIVVGFNLQWPTLLTLLMAPVLIIMYMRLAGWEEVELATFFGEGYLEYARRVPAFMPLRRAPSHRTLLGILIFLALGGGLAGLNGQADAGEHYPRALGVLTTEQGREAPDFTLRDPAGKVHRLRDYRGRVVLLGFGTTW